MKENLSAIPVWTFPAAALLLLLQGCGQGSVYEKTYEIPPPGWTYADTLDFGFDITDTTAIYNLYLDVRHSPEYDYQNLYVRLHTRFPSGQRIGETVSLELADKTGAWLGDCSSRSCLLKIPIQQGAYFNAAGPYLITVEQFMRRDSLPGIQAVAFRLQDSGRKR